MYPVCLFQRVFSGYPSFSPVPAPLLTDNRGPSGAWAGTVGGSVQTLSVFKDPGFGGGQRAGFRLVTPPTTRLGSSPFSFSPSASLSFPVLLSFCLSLLHWHCCLSPTTEADEWLAGITGHFKVYDVKYLPTHEEHIRIH